MPIRTRKKVEEEPQKIVRKEYPDQKQVIPQNGRVPISDTETDEYYYLAFLWRNTIDDFQDTVDLIKSKDMPFEWAKSPSNCICFRVPRKFADNCKELQKPRRKKYARKCPAFMPYSCSGRENLWQMEEYNAFPYLYTSWTTVLDKPVRKRRRR